MGRVIPFPFARVNGRRTVSPPSASPSMSVSPIAPVAAAGVGSDAFIADLPPARILAWLDEIREPATKLIAYVAQAITLVAVEAALHGATATVSLDEAIAAELLPPILERIDADKAEQGQFDYDDMLELVGKRWRSARPRARGAAARADAVGDDRRVPGHGSDAVEHLPHACGCPRRRAASTIVGDPKQAIYGFRGADVATYLAARDEMLRLGATRVSLDVNRRSTARSSTAVNPILDRQTRDAAARQGRSRTTSR